MRRVVTAVAVALAFACAAAAARADVAVVARGTSPFDGGVAVTSPLEQIAGRIASTVAGRPVSVRCESDADWAALASNHRFFPHDVLGFVSFDGDAPVDFVELSPNVCRSLQAFAGATTKPTKCATTKVLKKVKGKKVVTRRTVTVTTYGPCFVGGRELTTKPSFWNTFTDTAESLQALVHESIHLKGNDVEAEAECYGMQWLSYAARQLGDTADDAAAITAYYVTRLYPAQQGLAPTYWSAECKQDGPLDLTPHDGLWP